MTQTLAKHKDKQAKKRK